MRFFSTLFIVIACLIGLPVDAQNALYVNGTAVIGGTNGHCLKIGSSTLTDAPCLAGAVTTWSGGSTGFTPNTPTTGAVVLAGNLNLSSMASIAANTLMGNGTAGSTTPQALAVPSCSGTLDALGWTSGTGFLCHSIPSSSGDVVGPASSTDNLVATFDGTTGKLLKSTTTPNLGTPSAVNLTNGNSLPIAGISGFGTGVATALATNVGVAGAPVIFDGAGGTPSSIALTNGSSLPLSGLATEAANTVVGNATSGAASPTALAMASCSVAGSALNWTTNTGFGCNSSITAAAVPLSGVTGFGTGVATALAVNVGTAGSFVVNGGALGTPSSGIGTNLTGIPTTGLTGTLQAGQFPALTGDVTTSAGALGTTLATVNSNVGSFGSATQASTFTVNAKGLITAAANVTVTPAVGSITGLGTGIATALGVNVGSAGAPVLFNGAGGTPSSLTLTNATGLPIAGLTGNQASYVWSSSAASGSTVSFTSLSCEDVLIYVDGVTITTSTADLNILFSTNNGSTYTSASRINVTASALTTSAVYLTEWITGLRGGYVRAFGGESTTGNPNSTPNVSTAGPRTIMFAPAAQVNAIRFAPSASTFAAGTLRIGCRG